MVYVEAYKKGFFKLRCFGSQVVSEEIEITGKVNDRLFVCFNISPEKVNLIFSSNYTVGDLNHYRSIYDAVYFIDSNSLEIIYLKNE